MEAFMSLEKASEAAHFHPAESNHLVVLLLVAAEEHSGVDSAFPVCVGAR